MCELKSFDPTKSDMAFATRAMLTALLDGTTFEEGLKATRKRDQELYELLFVRKNDPVGREILRALTEEVYNRLRKQKQA